MKWNWCLCTLCLEQDGIIRSSHYSRHKLLFIKSYFYQLLYIFVNLENGFNFTILINCNYSFKTTCTSNNYIYLTYQTDVITFFLLV